MDEPHTYAYEVYNAVAKGRLEEALGLAERRASQAPKDAKCWGLLAHVHEMRRDFPAALAAAARAVELAPSDPKYHFKQGHASHQLGDPVAAAAAFGASFAAARILSDPHYLSSARIAQAWCLALAGQADAARAALADVPPGAFAWIGGRVSKEAVEATLAKAP